MTKSLNFDEQDKQRMWLVREGHVARVAHHLSSPSVVVRDIFENTIPGDLDSYGEDPEAPMPSIDESCVSFPPVEYKIQDQQMDILKNAFSIYVINVFLQVKDFLQRLASSPDYSGSAVWLGGCDVACYWPLPE